LGEIWDTVIDNLIIMMGMDMDMDMDMDDEMDDEMSNEDDEMDDEVSYVSGALNRGAVYIEGVVDSLDDQAVLHTIVWERLEQDWRQYMIENRTYGMAAFDANGVRTVVYLGGDGRLKTQRRPAALPPGRSSFPKRERHSCRQLKQRL
jgi:hypothetical protein